MRCWERALRRAGLAVVYSEGFTPHPKFSLASPLPVGIASRAELIDVFFADCIFPDIFRIKMRGCLPRGLTLLEVMPISPSAVSLQSLVRFAEYRVIIQSDRLKPDVEQSIRLLLDAKEIPWQHVRDKTIRSYNLRSMINEISIAGQKKDGYSIDMLLRCDSGGSGRPEQVTKALGFTAYPSSITRTNIILH
jgi:radical SAM-linked protein